MLNSKIQYMTSLAGEQEIQKGLFQVLLERMQEGGAFVMFLILICGLLTLFLVVRGVFLIKNKDPKIAKIIILINSIGLFALVLGVFGQLLKLIGTLDYMHFTEGIQPSEFAGGLKFTLLPTLFGCLIFLIARFITIVLNWLSDPVKQ